jgi:hypothetical protein
MKHPDKMTKEEVEEALYELIDEGLVEAHAIDEDGNFAYRLTQFGKDVGKKLKNRRPDDEE